MEDRRQREDKYIMRFPDGMRDRLKSAALAAHRSMNSEIVARLTASFERENATPALPVPNEPAGHGLDVDRLDRLTAIVDRTRLALGQAAARQLWPMLGLPALRTSSPRAAAEERGPDLLSLLDAPPGAKLGRTVKDCVADFIAERCEPDPLAEVKAAEFRSAYERWAKARGLPTASRSVLGKFAIGHGIQFRKSGGSIYVGLRLKSETEPPAAKRGQKARS